MLAEDIYFKTLTNEELWKRYCGFLDLGLDEFMQVQRALMAEQLSLVSDSLLGRKILGPRPPRTVEQFRATVPFTTYEDYEPFLSEKREDALAATPAVWCHSSGKGGKFKWVPHSERLMEKTARDSLAVFILGAAQRRGEIALAPGARLLTGIPLAPYTSGTIFDNLVKRFTLQTLPPQDTVRDLPFREQVARAFQLALRDGFDFAGAIASVLVRMGEQMSGQAGATRPSLSTLHPKVLFRLVRGLIRSKVQNRPIYPRDLWNPRGIMAAGVDASIYKEAVKKYWGVTLFDIYACTETMVIGMQSWTKKHMTLLSDSVFLEFLPLREEGPSTAKPNEALLLDQLEPGRMYEIVISQFFGMPLLRYRLGDVVQVTGIGDPETGITLPQIDVRRKVGEAINLGGLCSLDERSLWSAIAASGLQYVDWTAVKEYNRSETHLRLFIELKENRPAAEVSRMVDAQLKVIDTDYADVEEFLEVNPIRTTILSQGTFARYVEEKLREGASLAHLKPSHVNPPAALVQKLVSLGSVVDEDVRPS